MHKTNKEASNRIYCGKMSEKRATCGTYDARNIDDVATILKMAPEEKLKIRIPGRRTRMYTRDDKTTAGWQVRILRK